MDLVPYLNFNGQCAEAFQFYQKCLGGKIVAAMTFGETPAKDHVPPDWQGKIMHTRLEVNGRALMGSDGMPNQYKEPAGMTVALTVASAEEGKRLFDAISQGGKVTMPFEKTFWSPGFGHAVDRFGIPWMINTDPASQPE